MTFDNYYSGEPDFQDLLNIVGGAPPAPSPAPSPAPALGQIYGLSGALRQVDPSGYILGPNGVMTGAGGGKLQVRDGVVYEGDTARYGIQDGRMVDNLGSFTPPPPPAGGQFITAAPPPSFAPNQQFTQEPQDQPTGQLSQIYGLSGALRDVDQSGYILGPNGRMTGASGAPLQIRGDVVYEGDTPKYSVQNGRIVDNLQGIASLDAGQRTPQVRQDPTVTPPAPSPGGHFERRGQGEDAYDEWVPDPVVASPAPARVSPYGMDATQHLAQYARDLGFGDDPFTRTTTYGGESGNQEITDISGVTSAFDQWLAQHPGYTTRQERQGNKGTEYLLDPQGKVVSTRAIDFGGTDIIDKLLAVAPSLIVGAATGGLGLSGLAAGALTGAASPAIQAFTQGKSLEDALTSIGKGALLGGVGGELSQLINPAAASVGQAVGGGNEFLTKLATDAASGAGRSLVGSVLTGGKNLGDSLLTGALGGAASGAVNTTLNDLVNATGLPPDVVKVLAPTIVAAATGKDWQSTALTSGLGALISGAGQTSAADTGDETERLLKRYPAPTETPAEEPVVETQKLTTTPAEGADFTQQWYPEQKPVDEQAQQLQDAVKALTEEPKDYSQLIDELFPEQKTEETTPERLQQDIDALTEEPQDYSKLIDELFPPQEEGDGLGDWTQLLGDEQEPDIQSLTALEQDDQEAGQPIDDSTRFIDTHDEGYESDPEKFVQDLIDQMYQQQGKDEKEDPTNLLLQKMIDEGYGNLEEDYTVVPGGVKSTYTGEVGTFDSDGNWVPSYKAPSTSQPKSSSGASGKTPVTPSAPVNKTPITQTSSGGGFDMGSLLALLALMGDSGQQQAQAPELFKSNLDVNKLFKNWSA